MGRPFFMGNIIVAIPSIGFIRVTVLLHPSVLTLTIDATYLEQDRIPVLNVNR
jgi:hypothetical protein